MVDNKAGSMKNGTHWYPELLHSITSQYFNSIIIVN
jgi:hypothetical protein